MKKHPLLAVIGIFLVFNCAAQNCEVNIDALKGSYSGDCKSNKAHGKGSASGEDSYTGEFKNGLPDGFGKYTWKNGDWYEGYFKKGLREGKGGMHYNVTVADSLEIGFWKKDRYLGKYEHPYVVHKKSANVNSLRVEMQKNSKLNQITFTLESVSGGTKTISGIVPKVEITGISINQGTFLTRVDRGNSPKTNITILGQVEFPFRATITMDNEMIDLEISEAGNWEVDIRIFK